MPWVNTNPQDSWSVCTVCNTVCTTHCTRAPRTRVSSTSITYKTAKASVVSPGRGRACSTAAHLACRWITQPRRKCTDCTCWAATKAGSFPGLCTFSFDHHIRRKLCGKSMPTTWHNFSHTIGATASDRQVSDSPRSSHSHLPPQHTHTTLPFPHFVFDGETTLFPSILVQYHQHGHPVLSRTARGIPPQHRC